jgi:hypothetical protein
MSTKSNADVVIITVTEHELQVATPAPWHASLAAL